ncbi:MAG: DUF3276 family protein [Bacteroidales bacterium]|nr:DUF3276 family protein [Bacteroidales bacterium]
MEDGQEKKDEQVENNDDQKNNIREEIFSEVVRAGRRTYFFDVKATRKNEYYLTVTESKKRFNREGNFFYEKHKIFLYKEDFDKFSDALVSTLDFIKDKQPNGALTEDENTETSANDKTISNDYTNVEFEDLEEKKE